MFTEGYPFVGQRTGIRETRGAGKVGSERESASADRKWKGLVSSSKGGGVFGGVVTNSPIREREGGKR